MQWLSVILVIPYVFFLAKIFKSLQKIKRFIVTAEPRTAVSVVVACRDEEDHLPHLLKCISEQNYPSHLLEIIIVDDNSTDGTYQIASRFREKTGVLVLKNDGSGKKHALRTGISHSSGELILTTDADCRMGKRWVGTIAACYEMHRPDMIICPVQVESAPGFFGKFQELEFLSLQGITAGSSYSGNGTMCNGANLAFTRETYRENAGNLHFEIATGDDVFLLHSLKKQANAKILWLESKDAVVTTESAGGIPAYFRQRRRWISKVGAYNDQYSIILGTITFFTIILQTVLLVLGIFDPAFLPLFLVFFFLKSVPDFLILRNTTTRYDRQELMNWFLPSQIIYPFYVLSVIFYSVITLSIKNINSPFRRGT